MGRYRGIRNPSQSQKLTKNRRLTTIMRLNTQNNEEKTGKTALVSLSKLYFDNPDVSKSHTPLRGVRFETETDSPTGAPATHLRQYFVPGHFQSPAPANRMPPAPQPDPGSSGGFCEAAETTQATATLPTEVNTHLPSDEQNY